MHTNEEDCAAIPATMELSLQKLDEMFRTFERFKEKLSLVTRTWSEACKFVEPWRMILNATGDYMKIRRKNKMKNLFKHLY